MGEAKVFVGDLGSNASKEELEDAFSSYGRLRNVWIARNPPGFAFVEFDEIRDAEDAVRGLDGRTICGRRAKVEMARGGRSGGRRGSRGGGGGFSRGGRGGRPFSSDDRCYQCGERGHYARDCRGGGGGGYGGGGGGGRRRSRSGSRSPRRRSYSRSRSRSPSSGRQRSRS